jgi:hypothetical protein
MHGIARDESKASEERPVTKPLESWHFHYVTVFDS